VLAELAYRNPGARPYADLDALVEPSGFPTAIAALEQAGARLADRNWLALRRELRGQVHVVLPSGVPLDLHWNLVNMYRRRIWIDTGELLARATRVDLAGLAVPTLEPTDTVIHLAVHAGLSGGDRLMWLKDLERSIAVRPPDWQAVVGRARAWRVTSVVGLMLARAHEVAGARVPGDVRRQLLGPGTARLIRFVDRVSPWELAAGRLSALNVVLARSIGHGPAGGLAWIAARSLRNLDPREPRASGALTPSGDERDRAAFLAAVRERGGATPHPAGAVDPR
jgi:hypothetical protein